MTNEREQMENMKYKIARTSRCKNTNIPGTLDKLVSCQAST